MLRPTVTGSQTSFWFQQRCTTSIPSGCNVNSVPRLSSVKEFSFVSVIFKLFVDETLTFPVLEKSDENLT